MHKNYIKQFMDDNNLELGEKFLILDYAGYTFEGTFVIYDNFMLHQDYKAVNNDMFTHLLSGSFKVKKIEPEIKELPFTPGQSDNELFNNLMNTMKKVNELVGVVNKLSKNG